MADILHEAARSRPSAARPRLDTGARIGDPSWEVADNGRYPRRTMESRRKGQADDDDDDDDDGQLPLHFGHSDSFDGTRQKNETRRVVASGSSLELELREPLPLKDACWLENKSR
ncbi:unnamed protein product [Heligmosomoides polygyrus]|uniref:Uncharacterized protein n=1 Tax=Heligmosomoides polygyrus TaxID=6339 RepID=A0A183FE71_HELPZ|nr:unnamed protein product [Heligmosomoides polygyrus]